MRILIADEFPQLYVDRLTSLGHDVLVDPSIAAATLPSVIPRFEALVVRSTRVTAETIAAAEHLGLIVRAGAGVSTIDIQAAADRGIVVCNTPGKDAIAVAELAMGLIIAIDRNIPDNVGDLRAGSWNKKMWSHARGLAGRRLGIVGFGAVGVELARRAHGFDMQVGFVDKPGRAAEVSALIEGLNCRVFSTLEELLRESDIVSFHVPPAPDTARMINREMLTHVRPGTVLINTARADIVDEEALLEAIEEKELRVGVDVYAGQPGFGQGAFTSALAQHPAVYGTHHIGASTEQSQNAIAQEVVGIVEAFGRGVMRHAVNLAEAPVGDTVITVRHYDRVGVLARVLEILRDADLNVEQMVNTVFAGARTASAAINLSQRPDAATLEAIGSTEDVISVSTGSYTGPRPAVRGFDGYLPRSDIAHRVTAPPLSSITVDRFEKLVTDHPLSILRVMRSAIDTLTGGSAHTAEDEHGAELLQGLIDGGALHHHERSAFFVYRVIKGGTDHLGLVAEVATVGLDDGTIRPHEGTRVETEDLVLERFRRVRAHTDPVAMTYRADDALAAILQSVTDTDVPTLDFDTSDGARHVLWVVDDVDRMNAITGRLASVDRLYVTDGHHRARAARRNTEEQAARNPAHTGTEPYGYLTAVLFADDQIGLEGYHRCLVDLGDVSAEDVLRRIDETLTLEELAVEWAEEAKPREPGQVGMLLDGRWYRLTFPPVAPGTGVYQSLGALRPQDRVLGPILAVADPETDPRLEYIPGPAGLGEFARRGVVVGFALYRPAIADVMAVADAGEIMPPKSTWFEPKVRAGLVVRRF